METWSKQIYTITTRVCNIWGSSLLHHGPSFINHNEKKRSYRSIPIFLVICFFNFITLDICQCLFYAYLGGEKWFTRELNFFTWKIVVVYFRNSMINLIILMSEKEWCFYWNIVQWWIKKFLQSGLEEQNFTYFPYTGGYGVCSVLLG